MATSFSTFSATNSRDAALAIFCRAPVLGNVKTRLAATNGAPFALELYRAMLRDTFAIARQLAPAVETFACHTPAEAFDENSELRALWSGATLPQITGGLGEKMRSCLEELRARGFGRVAIIGSDSPDLPVESLKRAFAALEENDVVVGPSFDGGFYLLGAACALPPQIFQDIEWSQPDVFARLQENLNASQLKRATLPIWRDVDEAPDVAALRARLSSGATCAAATARFLGEFVEGIT